MQEVAPQKINNRLQTCNAPHVHPQFNLDPGVHDVGLFTKILRVHAHLARCAKAAAVAATPASADAAAPEQMAAGWRAEADARRLAADGPWLAEAAARRLSGVGAGAKKKKKRKPQKRAVDVPREATVAAKT